METLGTELERAGISARPVASMTNRLVHEAPCPVMVLTRTAVEDGAPSEAVARGAHAS